MQPYHPSNAVPLRGWLFLLLAVVVGGAAIGGLTFLVDKLVYLVCLFPIIMGFAGGFLISQACRLGKVRNPWVALAAGILMGVVIYGAYTFFTYLGFREQVYTELVNQYGDVSRADVEEYIDISLEEMYGQPGMVGYLSMMAEEGVQIGRVGSSSSSSSQINLQNEGAWIYWGLELLVIVVVSAILGRQQATQPFCESCDEWIDKEETLGLLTQEAAGQGMQMAKSGALRALGEMCLDLATPIAARSWVLVQVAACKRCMSSDARLSFKQVTLNKKNQAESRVALQGMISPTQLSDLRYGLRNRAPEPAPAPVAPPIAPQAPLPPQTESEN